MYDRMQALTPDAFDVIRNTTMAVLAKTGMASTE